MRLALKDIDKRVSIKLDKSIRKGNNGGVMLFGKDNDYPQKIERIVNSSITAKSCRDIYSKFLCGQGFANDQINSVIVGKDERGKNVTLKKILSLVCDSIALNHGAYIHINLNLNGIIGSVRHMPFKYCRFVKPDDIFYCSHILFYENWERDSDYFKDKKFNKSDIKHYPIFNSDPAVIEAQVKEAGSFKKFKGQVNFIFLDDQHLYPLSPFDPVYMDCDTENQVAIYKNNTTRNGMTKKTIVRMQEPSNSTEEAELSEQVKSWQGADGDNVLVLYDEIDPQSGEIKTTGAFAVDTLESAIDDKLFEGWQKDLSNNIRKAVRALPAVLIDYDESKLGTTSGEGIIQAVNFYNAMTEGDRSKISEMFREIFTKFDNDILKSNTDWTIKKLDLYGNFNVPTASTD